MKVIESLEGRRLLSTVTWDGGGGADIQFSNPANWSGDQVPTAADDAVVTLATGKLLQASGTFAFRSLTIANNSVLFGIPLDLTVTEGVHLQAGASVQTVGATIQGSGKFIVDAGATIRPAPGGSVAPGSDFKLAIDNYGSFGFAGGGIGPAFHNYASAAGYDTTVAFGIFYNEAGATLTTATVPNQPGSVTLGLQKNASGEVIPAPFYNYGTINTGTATVTPGPTPPGYTTFYTTLNIYVDASPNLGGTWNASGGQLTLLTRDPTTPATLTLAPDFSLLAGTLYLNRVNATVHGFATNSALSITGGTVTLDQLNTELSVLEVGGAFKMATGAGGSRRLYAHAVKGLGAGTSVDIGDNLFIDGNEQSGTSTPPTLPAYQANVRGSYNGVTLTVQKNIDPNASATAGVGFTTGQALASVRGNHTIDGATFDDNDFVFRSTLRGDANLDRTVNFDDLIVMAMNYNRPAYRGYADGNFDNPAVVQNVNFDDLILIAQNYKKTFSITPILAADLLVAKKTPAKRANIAGDVLA